MDQGCNGPKLVSWFQCTLFHIIFYEGVTFNIQKSTVLGGVDVEGSSGQSNQGVQGAQGVQPPGGTMHTIDATDRLSNAATPYGGSANQSVLGLAVPPGGDATPLYQHATPHHSPIDQLPPLQRAGAMGDGCGVMRTNKDKDVEGRGKQELCGEVTKTESGMDQGSAQYLSANCVVFTYYTGDISKVVDEHFSKALSHSPEKSKDTLPLSQRNLPASFWDSEWTPPPSLLPHPSFPASELYTDPYTSPLGLGQTDPWQNYMAAQVAQAASGSAYSAHRGMDMYSARSYSSLLLQSNLGRGAGRSLPKEAWSSPSHASLEPNYSSSHPHYSAMTGLDGSMQGSSKDLYWF